MTKRILVVGSGAREHALAYRLACGATDAPLSDREVFLSPGNAGIAREFPCIVPERPGIDGWVAVSRDIEANLVVVGPEQPLVDGLVDALERAGIPVLGPRQACAALEGSKAFMKDLVSEAGVPTARYGVFERLHDAERLIAELPHGAVVKADGLAAGKGVTVCRDPSHARDVAAAYLGESGKPPQFGSASARIVVEEFLPGLEVSVIALCDGEEAIPFVASRDHKRLLDDDQGPNTGGMGAVCPLGPAEAVTPALLQQVQDEMLRPTLAALKARGTPYRGFLYAGLMVFEGRAKLLEYNVRFGDPEAEAVLYGTQIDLLELFETVAQNGRFRRPLPDLSADCAPTVTVVCASPGYPEAPHTGTPIAGLDEAQRVVGAKVFFAGVQEKAGILCTAGGRVLTCSATGATLAEARERAYQAVDCIRFDGKQVRRDIGHTVLGPA